MKQYNFAKIEKKWQKVWEDKKPFHAEDVSVKPKYYALVEFPYPSGAGLHVGHPRPYTALDVVSRKKRMDGYNVLFPIGFDSFGLPTENYAIKTGRPPAEVTKENIANFVKQLKMIGFSFDWDRVVDTSSPEYYRWTQWLFLRFFEHGLAYKTNMPINWCLSCKIGLANEEVVNGKCERCGGDVEKRNKEQWMLAITKYADKLLEGLKDVDYLPQIKTQQENWIGKSVGASILFGVETEEVGLLPEKIEVFTTRADTLFGVTYVSVAPENEKLESWKKYITNWDEVEKYISASAKKSDLERTELNKDKTGVKLLGVEAVNPVNGEAVPIFVADYVLNNYGTGIVMAVPAHDTRDFEFAKKYDLQIREVVKPINAENLSEEEIICFTGEGKNINSDFLDGLQTKEAQEKICVWLSDPEVQAGDKKINYKLRDWVFSRQRYWGEPIPLVYCSACANAKNFKSKGEELNPGWIPLEDKDLPLELPKVKDYKPTDNGESPLSEVKKFTDVKCPRCGCKAHRETDTMPNWAGSSWYFLRYIDPKNKEHFADFEKLKYWMPIDWYNGGMEHVVLHLLYSRFWNIFLHDLGLVPVSEPYKKRTAHGMILASDGQKMSKSKGNVINPDDVIKEYGADTFRTYIMFMGPFDQAAIWDTNGLIGVKRFLERVWNLQEKIIPPIPQDQRLKDDLSKTVHRTIKKVGDDIDNMRFNTAIAKMMELVNEMNKKTQVCRDAYEILLKILSPFAPHMCEEIWSNLGNKETLSQSAWPKYDEVLARENNLSLVIQVNGKVRDTIDFSTNEITEDDARNAALSSLKVLKWLDGKEPKKVVYVPGKLVNIVV
ncbi:MAG TPA: leucine--tRNA ligase [Candidatus Magasanikbacteria bacterium]|nr:leucine--tRNA ligase [Candidatus Magasanikbacteria bacterium]